MRGPSPRNARDKSSSKAERSVFGAEQNVAGQKRGLRRGAARVDVPARRVRTLLLRGGRTWALAPDTA